MTISFSFTLLSPAPAGPAPVGSALPSFATGGELLACNGVSYDQAHFLALFERILPPEYITPLILNPNSGYELLQALAKIGERVSLAIERLECGSFIVFAEGPVRAQVPVAFTRGPAAPTATTVTIRAGTIVATSRHGRRFRVLNDATLGSGDVSVGAVVEALDDGYEYNVEGAVITPRGETLEGEIDTIVTLYTDPAFVLDDLVVTQTAWPTQNGKTADLDGLGDNRGIFRARGEGDTSYRTRIRSFPDVVSPAAIRRTVTRILSTARVPIDFAFIETFEHRYQECWDAPSPNPGTPTYDGGSPPLSPLYDDTVFVYDDPRPVDRPEDFRNRWLDDVEFRGAFLVVLPRDVTLLDVGLAYDDPGTRPSDFLDPSTGVRRGTPAYDITNEDDAIIMTAAYDGFDIERAALYAAVYADVQRIKAAGVAGIIETTRE